MRVSSDPQDAAYNPQQAKNVLIYLDGKLAPVCVTADEERGEIIALVRDAAGQVVPDPSQPDGRKRQVLRGHVRIELQRMNGGHP